MSNIKNSTFSILSGKAITKNHQINIFKEFFMKNGKRRCFFAAFAVLLCTSVHAVTPYDPNEWLIEDGALKEYYGIAASVTIPDGVTSIGEEAFRNCTNLTSVTIPDSVTSIGEEAFRNCSNLTSVTIPANVRSIDKYVFKNCSRLTSVTIPNSVRSIDRFAFYHCFELTSINFKGTKAEWNAIVGEDGYLCKRTVGETGYPPPKDNYHTIICTDGIISK